MFSPGLASMVCSHLKMLFVLVTVRYVISVQQLARIIYVQFEKVQKLMMKA